MLPDWRGQQTRGRKLLWADEGETWRRRVRQFLSRKRLEEGEERREAAAAKLSHAELSNWHSVVALDSSLRTTFGLGLAAFQARTRLRMLEPGETRRWLPREHWAPEIAAASSGRLRRSVICRLGQEPALEACWGGARAVLHLQLDQRAVGWPSRGWLLHGLPSLRGSRAFDVPHRRQQPLRHPPPAAAAGAPGRFAERFYDREAAAAWLPATGGCSISLVGDRQWQVKYLRRAVRPKSRTVTFAAEGAAVDQRAHVAALRQCVQWAWDCHQEATGNACPWPLGLPWEG